MQSFDYLRPMSAVDAQASATASSRYVAGGTNLVDLMKVRVEAPTALIDLQAAVGGAVGVPANGGLRLDAGASNTAVAAHAHVREKYPVLARAILSGASAQIRNRATMAGNLLQRTRCSYFYDVEHPCNKRRPGTGCSAQQGMNRMHAIFGGSAACVATHPSDMAVALTALDAEVDIVRRSGLREVVPIALLHTLPGTTPDIESVLSQGDLITGVTVPAITAPVQIYRKVRDRASFAFALVSVAAVLSFDGQRVAEARLAFGGVAPKPWRRPEAEKRLIGTRLTPADIESAASAAVDGAMPLAHNAFKVVLLQQILRQVLGQAAAQRQEKG